MRTIIALAVTLVAIGFSQNQAAKPQLATTNAQAYNASCLDVANIVPCNLVR